MIQHVETIRWDGGLEGCVRLIDQTLLPEHETVLSVRTVDAMSDAIKRLAVRGAPAIGVAAAFGVYLGVQRVPDASPANVLGVAKEAAATLARARPTAVNLFWGLARAVKAGERAFTSGIDGPGVQRAIFEEAQRVWSDDRATCALLGDVGEALIEDGATVLTHCNAGALATAGMGTALAPIYCAIERGKRVRVFADETRPLLQGARLTAWELARAGVDVTLITDSMAGRVLFEGRIDLVLVGSDRIALNGDVCNKIGTYSVAVLAREHGVPFYAVAPLSTFDREMADGAAIPIEERAEAEITEGFGRRTAPRGVRVYNPAFDVTPARLITGIVTEVGLIRRPNRERVAAALARGGVRA